jgi:hypothetical protein
MIWQKEGRDYTCTSTLTPGSVELAFHGDNDLKRLRIRRFGYSSVNLDVKSTDKEVGAALGRTYSSSFLIVGSDPPDDKQLIGAVKKEFEQTLLPDQEAFRCAPFELVDINVHREGDTKAFVLSVDIRLDRSFGGPAFRQASHAFNAQDRTQKTGQIALDGGLGEVLVRFHRIAAKFPEVKDIIVVGSYSTTEARLDTEKTPYSVHLGEYVYRSVPQVGGGTKVAPVWVPRTVESMGKNTSVKGQEAERAIIFVMPNAQIPDTLDKKAISDAVLTGGKILIESVGGKE